MIRVDGVRTKKSEKVVFELFPLELGELVGFSALLHVSHDDEGL